MTVEFAGSNLEAQEYLRQAIEPWAEEHDLNVVCWNAHGRIHRDGVYPSPVKNSIEKGEELEIRFWSVPDELSYDSGHVQTAFGVNLGSQGAADAFIVEGIANAELNMTFIRDQDSHLIAIYDDNGTKNILYVTFDLPHFTDRLTRNIMARILDHVPPITVSPLHERIAKAIVRSREVMKLAKEKGIPWEAAVMEGAHG